MKLTNVQQKAVDKILNYYFNNERIIDFIAPTGSGKTFMIANVISKIIERSFNEKIIFVIFTLSNAELPIQFKNKLDYYQEFLDQKFNSIYYESPSAKDAGDNDCYIKYKDKEILIFGTASFGKNKIFTKLDRFKDFIDDAKNNNYRIVYIRDEAHIGDKTNINKSFETEQKIINESADFIIKMTATPDRDSSRKIVYISEKDLNDVNNNVFLLKTNAHLNIGFKNTEIDDNDVLDIAIKEFKKIKQQYQDKSRKNNYIINPAMLIQISSKNQNKELINENDIKIDEIINKLNQNNLSWTIYLSERKESSIREGINKKDINLADISKNNSSIDVIIFKLGPAIGWDIPRACMLVQLRRVCSEKLNQQTIGRIKRNPNKNLIKDDLYTHYWIYSDHQEKTREIHKYCLQEKFKNVKIPSVIAIDKDIYESTNKYQEFFNLKLLPFLNQQKENIIKIYKEIFINKNEIIINRIKYSCDDAKCVNYVVKLNNYLELKTFIFNSLNENQWLKMNDIDKIFNLLELNKQMNLDQFCLILFRNYINEINSIRIKFFSHKSKYEINYNNVLPLDYIVYENKNNRVDFQEILNIYGYRYILLDENNKSITEQYLDSNPEKLFLNFLIKKIKENKLNNKIELLAKNPLASKVYFEYWNERESKYAKAYIDFIIKLKDKNEFIFIEIKSINDYDPIKSKSIRDTIINDYQNINLSNKDICISFSLIFVDDEKLDDFELFNDQNEGFFITLKPLISKDKTYNSLIEFLNNL